MRQLHYIDKKNQDPHKTFPLVPKVSSLANWRHNLHTDDHAGGTTAAILSDNSLASASERDYRLAGRKITVVTWHLTKTY